MIQFPFGMNHFVVNLLSFYDLDFPLRFSLLLFFNRGFGFCNLKDHFIHYFSSCIQASFICYASYNFNFNNQIIINY